MSLFVPDERLQRSADLTQWRLTVDWGTVQQLFEIYDIVAIDDFERRVDVSWNQSIRVSASGTLTILLRTNTAPANAFLETSKARGWQNPALSMELLLPAGEPGAVPVWDGILDSWTLEPGRLVVRGRIEWPWDPHLLVCRDYAITAEGSAAGLNESVWLPQIFGRNDGVPAPVLFPLDSVPLDEKLEPADSVIFLRALPAWSAAARVQVGEEVIFYTKLLDGPPRLEGLTRATPREHRRGAGVFLLPSGDVRWAAADHPAMVHTVRGGSPQGAVVAGLTIEQATLAGRVATILRAAQLPLVIEHAPFPIGWSTTADAESWDTLPETTAEFEYDAFAGPNAQSGARFSAAKPLLVADYLVDESVGERRHDLLEVLKLGFELSSRFNYTPETRFRVTVTRGPASVVEEFSDFQWLARAGQFAGSAHVAPSILFPDGELAAGLRRIVIPFDEATAASLLAWEDAPLAIDGGFNTWARRDQAAGDAVVPLQVLLHRDHIGKDRHVARFGLFARVRAEGAACPVRLRASNAGAFLHVIEAEAPTDWTTIGSWSSAGAISPGAFIDGKALYELSLPSGGILQVAELWLEVELEALPPPRIAKAGGATIPFVGLTEQSLPFFPLEVDIASLVPSENPWTVFNGLRIRYELLNAPQTYSLQIRNTRWVGKIRPALRAEVVTRLYTDTTGRLSAADGLCGPASVIQELMTHGDFAAIPGTAIDAGSFTSASAILARLRRRFRAWFAQEAVLGELIERALGESAALLAPNGGRWSLALLDQSADGSEPTLADAGDLLEFPKPLASEPGALKSSTLAVVHGSENSLIGSGARTGGDGRTAYWRATWLASGVARLAETAFTRLGGVRSRINLPLRSGWLALPIGQRVRLDTVAFGLLKEPAQVMAVSWRDAVLSMECELAPTGRTLFSTGDAAARQVTLPGRLLFAIGEVLVASFEADGSMRIRGEVREHVETTPSGEALYWDEANRQLIFSAGPVGSRFALVITEEGDLILPGELREFMDQPDDPPDNGWEEVGEALVFGTPQIGTIARFDEEGLKVGGEVKEGMEV